MEIDETSYEYMKIEFEETHCKIVDSKLNYAKITIDDALWFRKKTEMKDAYSHLRYTESKYNKKTNEHELLEFSFIDKWLTDKDIRNYEAMKIVPKNCPANIYNLWTPFAVDKMEDLNPEYDYAEEIHFVLNHIKIICSGDEAIYNYFIKWIGQMLKYPETKSKVLILFVSLVEGTGKGSVIRLLERIIGLNKVIATQQPETYVWGEFNSLMGNGYLVVLDELEKLQTSKSGMARLKGLITEPTFYLHGKQRDPVLMPSFHRFIGASNKILGALETKDGDRRPLIIRCDEKLAEKTPENKAYFTKFYDIIKDDSFIVKIYQYFINLDGLDKFESIIVPKSEYQEMLKEANVCVVEQFIKVFVGSHVNTKGNCSITAMEFYQQFKQWAESNGFKYETNSIKIGLKLQITLDKQYFNKEHGRTGSIYTFNITKLAEKFKIKSHEELMNDIKPESEELINVKIEINDNTTEEDFSDKECEDKLKDNLECNDRNILTDEDLFELLNI